MDRIRSRVNIIRIMVCVIVLGGALSHSCAAQTIGVKECAAQGYFAVKDDLKVYQVISGEHPKEYADYYRAIRERIAQRLKANYRDHYRSGDVEAFFVLNSNGSLNRIDLDLGRSAKDSSLVDIVASSIAEASPFPPFPKELDAPQLPFGLTVTFKEESD